MLIDQYMRVKNSHQVGVQYFAPGKILAREMDVLLTLEGEESKIRSREFEIEKLEAASNAKQR